MSRPAPADLIGLYERERRDPTPPATVRDLFAEPWGLHRDYLAVILMASWARAGANGWPLIDLPRADWTAMFEAVGYLHNGFRAEQMRPREPMTLYRGATPDYRDGLSWTTREADARFYAGRHPGGRLYTLDAEPAWLLARISGNVFAPGGEYVVNAPESAVRQIEAPAEHTGPHRVLFVCVGNICRSPLAEIALRARAAEEGVPLTVASAGVSAREGAPMDPGTLGVAARVGLDGTTHRARRFTRDDLTRFDRIVVLDTGAGRHVRFLAQRTRTSAAIEVRPVVNPWRRPERYQDRAREEIEAICRDVVETTPRTHAEPERREHGTITAADLEHARAIIRAARPASAPARQNAPAGPITSERPAEPAERR